MAINVAQARANLQSFQFQELFIADLGWNNPANRRPVTWHVKDLQVERREIANLSGVAVFEVITAEGTIPDAAMRRMIADEVAELHRENLLIFLDTARTSSVWYWVKRENGKAAPRSHTFVKGQPGEVLIGKLSAMFVDIGELDAEGRIELVKVASRVKQALDVEPVTKKFFSDFQGMHRTLLDAISGIADERDRRWYASVLLNRLMFVYFLQRRGFLRDQKGADDLWYLQHRLEESKERGSDRFYNEFLRTLFFEGFAKPEDERDEQTRALIGHVRYLNGGLFLRHQVEQTHADIEINDHVFNKIFGLFQAYDWSLDDSPGGNEKEINPAVLGYIFEKYINQKAFGAYYTRTEITEYLCEQTIHRLVLDKINETLPVGKQFATVGDLLLKPTPQQLNMLLRRILPELRLIDPACGSGAFLVAAMRTLISIYSGLFGKAKFSNDQELVAWVAKIEREHPNIDYYIRKQIITNNLFGVDIMAEATEIARLRLFLALVAAAGKLEDLEPLPNIDFNILAGNSLIGLLHVNEQKADAKRQTMQQMTLFETTNRDSYRELVREKNRLVAAYRNAAERLKGEDADTGLQGLRDQIQQHRERAADLLDALLLDEFTALGIKYEQATWDTAKNKEGKPKRRPLELNDIRALQPFHWGYEFDEVMNERGGFDAIITNPPWQVFKPNAKEFFADYSNLVSKKKMSIKEFEQEQDKLLLDGEIRTAWLDYQSRFAYQSEYYRNAPQYRNQTSVINGKKARSDTNWYKLFTEQCYNMLREGGQCGIIVPSGIYTDLGTMRIRDVLFTETEIHGLFGLSNEKFIFEKVHHAFKFCILAFGKGSRTESFTAAFRINPREAISPDKLEGFFHSATEHIHFPVDLIRSLSPDSLSLIEFKQQMDISIAQRMASAPLLGERLSDTWNIVLAREFDMTEKNARPLVSSTRSSHHNMPIFEGKMIWHFDHLYAPTNYWINEHEVRRYLLGREPDRGQKMDYQVYRWAFRRQSGSVNERTLVSTILPPVAHADNLASLSVYGQTEDRVINNKEQLYLCSVMNSFVIDYTVKQRTTTNLNFFYIYQLPVPRLTEKDAAFAPIVERAAKLVCTTPEYDELAAEVGLGDHTAGVTDAAEREKLRAELDGMVAHLYNLTEAELTHILSTFPLVEQRIKDGVLTEFRRRMPNPDDAQVAALIAAGEGDRVEFKVAAFWNAKSKTKDGSMVENVVQGVASYMNSYEGGSLFIGVENATNRVVGLQDDYAAANAQKADRDGYELWLRDKIGSALGQNNGIYYSTTFHVVDGKDVCRINVRSANQPVYLNGDLYVRIGNGKKKLNAQQAMEYVKQRWGK